MNAPPNEPVPPVISTVFPLKHDAGNVNRPAACTQASKPVVLVADAGPHAGLGHISRSSALAVALSCRGIDPRCYAHGAEEPFERDGVRGRRCRSSGLRGVQGGVLVVDSYTLAPDELEQAAESSRLVVMHDDGEPPRGVCLVVAPAGEKSQDAPARLDSLRHVALRPAFWGLPRRDLEEHMDQILVTTGSGQFDLLGQDIARALAAALPDAEITLVRGPYASASSPPPGIRVLDTPETLADALRACDLAVTAGGQTMLEAAAAGTPCVALPLADNQRRQVASLARLGAVHVVDPPRAEHAAAAAVSLAHDADQRRELSRKSQQAIDGYGALRVAFCVGRLAHGA